MIEAAKPLIFVSLEHLGYFILLSLLAEILGTIGGFGSSLFFVPIAGFFLDFYSVLGVTALFHLSSNVSKMVLFRKGVDKKLLINMGLPALALVLVGAWLSRYVDKKTLEFLLSGFLILLSCAFLFFRLKAIRPTLFNSMAGGALSGLSAGLLGTGGAIRGLVMAAFKLPKEVFIATSAFIDLFIDLGRSGVYFLNGFVHRDDLYLIPILFVVSLVGTYAGKFVLRFVSEDQFSRLVLVLIFGIGIVSLLRLFIQSLN